MSDELTAAEHTAFLSALLGGGEPSTSEPPDSDTPPDFDAGVREPAPAPEDPEGDHAELLKNLLAPRDPGMFP